MNVSFLVRAAAPVVAFTLRVSRMAMADCCVPIVPYEPLKAVKFAGRRLQHRPTIQ